MSSSRKSSFFLKFLLLLILIGVAWYAGYASRDLPGPAVTATPDHQHEKGQKYTCGMHPMIITDEPGLCPICNMELTPLKSDTAGVSTAQATSGERKIKYWVAPMDPTYIRDEPGKSPMGMDLVPVYADQAPAGPVIAVDPVTAQSMGVRTAQVEKRDLRHTIRTVGLVTYDEPKLYSINAKIDGWIEKLYVDQTGQQVKKGQALLEIYSPKLVSAQEEYLLALRNKNSLQTSPFPEIVAGGERLLEASRQRLLNWDISPRQIRALEDHGSVSKTLTLYAPATGIVKQKTAFAGQFIKAGEELFKIGDISNVWVFADIYEYELPWVKAGQAAEIKLPFASDKVLPATITEIYPFVEPQTRTVKARLEFANPGFELKPDMYVNVRIQTNDVKGVLAIPKEAVLDSGERQTVFVALGDGKFEPRQIKTGLQDEDGFVEVKQGLLGSEKVVTSAQFMLDSESRLREAIQKMLEPQQAPAAAADENIDDLFK